MTVVVDASALVAALVDGGPVGEWARAELRGKALAAPVHLHVEVSNALRRLVLRHELPESMGALAHADLVDTSVDVFPFAPLARRVWELHATVTALDAPYVALAEALDVPLVTCDGRLARASGPRCSFVVPG